MGPSASRPSIIDLRDNASNDATKPGAAGAGAPRLARAQPILLKINLMTLSRYVASLLRLAVRPEPNEQTNERASERTITIAWLGAS